jgi:hypothetical protein
MVLKHVPGMVMHICNPSYFEDGGGSIANYRESQTKLATPSLKHNITGVMAQVLQYLFSKQKALSLIPCKKNKFRM